MTEAENRISNIKSKHGEYIIELFGNIIRVDGKGVVTKPILEQYLEDVSTVTRPLNGKPWGFMIMSGVIPCWLKGRFTPSVMRPTTPFCPWRDENLSPYSGMRTSRVITLMLTSRSVPCGDTTTWSTMAGTLPLKTVG